MQAQQPKPAKPTVGQIIDAGTIKMLIWITKYWKPLALLALIVAAGVAWRIDRVNQYKAGEVAATAKLNAAITEAHKKQVAEVLEKERQATAALAAEQAKIERERQYASPTTQTRQTHRWPNH